MRESSSGSSIKKCLVVITGILITISFYFSIFWLEWILAFGVWLYLTAKIPRRWLRLETCTKMALLLLEFGLIIYLLFPLHLIFVWHSTSATTEVSKSILSGQFQCNKAKMECATPYEECNYQNTRNCVCNKCFKKLSYSDCNQCFVHDLTALCRPQQNRCELAW